MSLVSRRRFLTTAATTVGGITLGCSDRSIIAPTRAQLSGDMLPDPAASGIEHVIVFMMENRSFDHFLGWLPGADGQTDRNQSSTAISQLPPIWDRLSARGLVGRYYYGDLPFLGLWGAKYVPISRPIDAFYADCAAGTLPHVAFVDGSFAQELTGT